jgi:hypothetical protein
MPEAEFTSREILIETLHKYPFGTGINQWKYIKIFWNESIVWDKISSSMTASPNILKIIELNNPIEVEIFLNRNPNAQFYGVIYIHNAIGSYMGFDKIKW